MIVVSCSVVALADDKILLVREKKSIAKDKWGLPGGKLEESETLEACAIRELEEETGYKIKTVKPLAIVNKPRSREGNTVIKAVFSCRLKDEQPGANAELEYCFVTLSQLEKLKVEGRVRGDELTELFKIAQDNKTEFKILKY